MQHPWFNKLSHLVLTNLNTEWGEVANERQANYVWWDLFGFGSGSVGSVLSMHPAYFSPSWLILFQSTTEIF